MRGLSFKNKRKAKVCKKCKFDYICDALWGEYAKVNGFGELHAILGKKISDPTYFLDE